MSYTEGWRVCWRRETNGYSAVRIYAPDGCLYAFRSFVSSDLGTSSSIQRDAARIMHDLKLQTLLLRSKESACQLRVSKDTLEALENNWAGLLPWRAL